MSTNALLNARALPGSVRVVTQNLWGRFGAWEDRRVVLKNGLRKLQPDLVTLQEAVVNDEYDQVSDLLGPGYHIAHQSRRGADGSGISIASRWPYGEVRELDLHLTPRTDDFPCGLLLVEVSIPEPVGPVILVHHLPSWQLNFEYERELQAVEAERFVEEFLGQRNAHVVLAGDLDADPDAASVRFWSGRQALSGLSVCYRDAWESAHPGDPGETFSPRNPLVADWDWPFRRIDYIFVRCAEHGGPTLAISACERIFDEPVDGVWASDHFGLAADLAAPTPRSPFPS